MADNIWQPDSEILAAGQSAANSINYLAGTIGEYKSQKEANESRERIAAEQNAANAAENEKNREFEREMWKIKAEFGSPANVRKMLENAGINPYSAYGQQVNTPSSGSPSTHPMVGAQFETEDALGRGFKELARLNVDQIQQLADAREKNADAEAREIRNIFESHAAKSQARMAGYDADVREIDAITAQRKKNLELEGMDLANQNLYENNLLTQINQQLSRFDLFFLKPQQYAELVNQTKLLYEKAITEGEYRTYLSRMGNSAAMNAVANTIIADNQRRLVPYQQENLRSGAELNTSLAGVASQDYISKGLENDIKRFIGKPKAAAEFLDIVSRRGLNDAMSEKTYYETKHVKQAVDWNTYNEILKGLNTVTSGAGSAIMIKAILGL